MGGAKQRIFVKVGQRFGKLAVLRTDVRVGVTSSKPFGWRAADCLCDCGTEVTVTLSDLVSAKKKSCGCLRGANARTHGLSAHPLSQTHRSMVGRCYSEKSDMFPYYGARGIQVHEPWHDLATFIADIESSIGPRPEGNYPSGVPLYSLDRIDNNGNYEPGNIRWATAKEQQNNRRDRPRNRQAA